MRLALPPVCSPEYHDHLHRLDDVGMSDKTLDICIDHAAAYITLLTLKRKVAHASPKNRRAGSMPCPVSGIWICTYLHGRVGRHSSSAVPDPSAPAVAAALVVSGDFGRPCSMAAVVKTVLVSDFDMGAKVWS